mmetsp:Transcript_92328/g.240600  ORF Transcript_92328/g.240600 Transcript_92328/m.240600 type:complete len:155 (+) Transcript_92328:129-593(+)
MSSWQQALANDVRKGKKPSCPVVLNRNQEKNFKTGREDSDDPLWKCNKCSKENPGAFYRCEGCGDLKPEERQSRLEMRARDGVIGRGGGFVERQGAEVRKEHNSDDEEIDDFGRPKRRASGAAGAAARRAAALARLQNKRAAGTGRRASRSRSR